MEKQISNFKRDWLYKETVLDVCKELGLELSGNEYMQYYHNALLRISQSQYDKEVKGKFEK